MICGNCGAHLPDNAEYCPRCGSLDINTPEKQRKPAAPGGAPSPKRSAACRTVSMGTYFLWWTIALFSNAELVCCVLSFLFAFSTADRNRANFFRAVLLFKLLFLLIGLIAVLILALSGFSFAGLLNSIIPDALWDLISEVL